MTITKRVDMATPLLQSKCTSGTYIPKIELQVQRTDGKPGYLVYEMQNVVITSVKPGGSGGEDRLTENVTLNFSGISWEYTSIKDSTGGGETDFGWDIETNELK
jgi:type VI secretion system secreted protein Hcp